MDNHKILYAHQCDQVSFLAVDDRVAGGDKRTNQPVNGIPVRIFLEMRPRTDPCSDIVPTKIAPDSNEVGSLFHYGIIDRNLL